MDRRSGDDLCNSVHLDNPAKRIARYSYMGAAENPADPPIIVNRERGFYDW